jgi:uncharacterized protein YaiI (UPF0178 family)
MKKLKIYVDADACPKIIKEILYKTALRLNVSVIFVADNFLRIPQSIYISAIKVPSDIDSADEKIVELTEPGDLVITADIPLADQIVTKGAFALNPRGELYTEKNIKDRLAIRDMMAEMRSCGLEGGGPPAFSPKNKENFTNQLDRFLTKMLK